MEYLWVFLDSMDPIVELTCFILDKTGKSVCLFFGDPAHNSWVFCLLEETKVVWKVSLA